MTKKKFFHLQIRFYLELEILLYIALRQISAEQPFYYSLHLISMIHTLLIHGYMVSELLIILEWRPIKPLWALPSSLPHYYGDSLGLGWTTALCFFP